MGQPAIFFDRDNTLIINNGYLGDPAGVVLMDGAANAIARGRQLGFAIVVVSNQSGVARGMFDESAVVAVNARLVEMLLEQNPAAMIDRHEYCPFHPQAVVQRYRQDSPLRKPAPGMLLNAAAAMDLDLSRSWLIGDAPRDVQAGKAAGCHTILLVPPGVPASPDASATDPEAHPHHRVATLQQALDVIEQATRHGHLR